MALLFVLGDLARGGQWEPGHLREKPDLSMYHYLLLVHALDYDVHDSIPLML